MPSGHMGILISSCWWWGGATCSITWVLVDLHSITSPQLLGAPPWNLLRGSGCCQVFWLHVGTCYWAWELLLLHVKHPTLWDFPVMSPRFFQNTVPSAVLCGITEHMGTCRAAAGKQRPWQIWSTDSDLPSQDHTKPPLLCHCSCPWLVCDMPLTPSSKK